MSNAGFQPFMDLSVAAKEAGGPEAYIHAIKARHLAIGAGAGAFVGIVTGVAVVYCVSLVEEKIREKRERKAREQVRLG